MQIRLPQFGAKVFKHDQYLAIPSQLVTSDTYGPALPAGKRILSCYRRRWFWQTDMWKRSFQVSHDDYVPICRGCRIGSDGKRSGLS